MRGLEGVLVRKKSHLRVVFALGVTMLLHWLGPMRWNFFFGLMAGRHYPALPAVDGPEDQFQTNPES